MKLIHKLVAITLLTLTANSHAFTPCSSLMAAFKAGIGRMCDVCYFKTCPFARACRLFPYFTNSADYLAAKEDLAKNNKFQPYIEALGKTCEKCNGERPDKKCQNCAVGAIIYALKNIFNLKDDRWPRPAQAFGTDPRLNHSKNVVATTICNKCVGNPENCTGCTADCKSCPQPSACDKCGFRYLVYVMNKLYGSDKE